MYILKQFIAIPLAFIISILLVIMQELKIDKTRKKLSNFGCKVLEWSML